MALPSFMLDANDFAFVPYVCCILLVTLDSNLILSYLGPL